MPAQISLIFPAPESRGERIAYQIVFEKKDDHESKPFLTLFSAEEFERIHADMGKVIAARKRLLEMLKGPARDCLSGCKKKPGHDGICGPRGSTHPKRKAAKSRET